MERIINLPYGQCAANSLCRKALIENRKIIQPTISIEQFFGVAPDQISCPIWVENG